MRVKVGIDEALAGTQGLQVAAQRQKLPTEGEAGIDQGLFTEEVEEVLQGGNARRLVAVNPADGHHQRTTLLPDVMADDPGRFTKGIGGGMISVSKHQK